MKDIFKDPRMANAGFTPKALQGKSTDDQIAAFFAAMEKTNIPQNQRVFFAEKINDLSTLQDVFANNADEYNRLKDEYRKSGAAMGKSIEKLSHDWFVASARMSARFTGLQRLIGVRFASFVIRAMDQISAKLDEAAPSIREWVEGATKSFSGFVGSLVDPTSNVRRVIDSIVTNVRDFFSAVDKKTGETGFQTALQLGDAASLAGSALKYFSDMVGGPVNAAMVAIDWCMGACPRHIWDQLSNHCHSPIRHCHPCYPRWVVPRCLGRHRCRRIRPLSALRRIHRLLCRGAGGIQSHHFGR